MGKIFLILALAFTMLNRQSPSIIEGKWLVDKVDISSMKQKIPAQQMAAINNFLVKPLTNAVFEFKADHHFYLSPGLHDMPKNNSWEYDATSKVIFIRTYGDSRSIIMKIGVSEKDGLVFFDLLESPVVFKVHKL